MSDAHPPHTLEGIVFATGAIVMILELVGSRVVAPYVGTSLYVWTSLIGIVLGSLSVGYWWGGKLADKGASYGLLGKILFAAGIAVGGIKVMEVTVVASLTQVLSTLQAAAAASVLLFLVPSMFLGMVLPLAVGLRLHSLARRGSTVGNLYALSTVGSIVGTFLAGYYLIPQVGHAMVLLLTTLTLIGLSYAAIRKEGARPAAAVFVGYAVAICVVVALHLLGTQRGLVDVDTQYNRVRVLRGTDYSTGRQVLRLMTGSGAVQTVMLLDDPSALIVPYTKYYRLVDLLVPKVRRVTMIGGGGYAYPKEFIRTHPDATMDVVEIDPGVTALAKQYFRLTDNPRLRIIDEDGRRFLRTSREQYDAILVDVFSGGIDIPWHMATAQAFGDMKRLLASDGVVIMNVISALDGEKGEVLRLMYSTLRSVFPRVFVMAVRDPLSRETPQNIMLIAMKDSGTAQTAFAFGEFTDHLVVLPETNRTELLTDDRSRLEYATARMVQ